MGGGRRRRRPQPPLLLCLSVFCATFSLLCSVSFVLSMALRTFSPVDVVGPGESAISGGSSTQGSRRLDTRRRSGSVTVTGLCTSRFFCLLMQTSQLPANHHPSSHGRGPFPTISAKRPCLLWEKPSEAVEVGSFLSVLIRREIEGDMAIDVLSVHDDKPFRAPSSPKNDVSLHTRRPAAKKQVPVEDTIVSTLLAEPNRHYFRISYVLHIPYLKRLMTHRFSTRPPVNLLVPSDVHNLNSGFKLDLFQPQCIVTLLTINPQEPPRTESQASNPNILSEKRDGGQHQSLLGHHWYDNDLDHLSFSLGDGSDFGSSSLQIIVALWDSNIRLIVLLVGILYCPYLSIGWLVFGLDPYLGDYGLQAYLGLSVHSLDVRHILTLQASQTYTVTSLSEIPPRSR